MCFKETAGTKKGAFTLECESLNHSQQYPTGFKQMNSTEIMSRFRFESRCSVKLNIIPFSFLIITWGM